MKRTGWYRGDQKPVRVGVYERLYSPHNKFYSYWNGQTFQVGYSFYENAASVRKAPSLFQDLPWRGLAKEPK